jgi:hypothetical protein
MKWLMLLSVMAAGPDGGQPYTITEVKDSLQECRRVIKTIKKHEWFIHGACVRMEFLREKNAN